MHASLLRTRAPRGLVESLETRRLLAAAAVAHIYELNGSYADALGGSSVVPAGGTLGSTGYTFAAGQGPNVSNAINTNEYSLEVLFKFTTVSGGYQSMVDFKNRTTEAALYTLNGKANLYPHTTGTTTIAANATTHLVITRDGTTKDVSVYVNGTKQFTYPDTNSEYTFSAANRILNLFRDNSTENGPGFIDRVRIYAGVLTQTEVTSLKNGGTPPGLAQVSVVGGVLTLVGSSGNDTIGVTLSGTTYTAKIGTVSKTFASSGLTKISIDGGDGNDGISIGSTITLPSTIRGGTGNDTITGGAGADTIDGGLGSDVISGAGGLDTVDYASRTTNVNIFLDGLSNDGAIGEHDNVKTDVETVLGGQKDDVIYGSAVNNKLVGNAGNDYLFGLGGNDSLDGGSGNDELAGGDGNDTITGGSGNDYFYGEAGNDSLIANDGVADTVDGGDGTDTSVLDPVDVKINLP